MPRILIFGFGNVLRADDGVGVRVAERLRDENWPADVGVIAAHQLLPEHADLLKGADRVVFVDAAEDVAPGEIEAGPLGPAGAPAITLHHLTPAALLAACTVLYGRAPEATFVRIGVESTETSAALSTTLAARLEACCERVRQIVLAWGPTP